MQKLVFIIFLSIFFLWLVGYCVPKETFNNICNQKLANKEFNRRFLRTQHIMSKDGIIKGIVEKKYLPYKCLQKNTLHKEDKCVPYNFVFRDSEYEVLSSLDYDDPEVANRIRLPYYKTYNL